MSGIRPSSEKNCFVSSRVMSLGGTIEYFRDTVFNYPTMAECYKVAALDGLNKLSLWEEAVNTPIDCTQDDIIQRMNGAETLAALVQV